MIEKYGRRATRSAASLPSSSPSPSNNTVTEAHVNHPYVAVSSTTGLPLEANSTSANDTMYLFPLKLLYDNAKYEKLDCFLQAAKQKLEQSNIDTTSVTLRWRVDTNLPTHRTHAGLRDCEFVEYKMGFKIKSSINLLDGDARLIGKPVKTDLFNASDLLFKGGANQNPSMGAVGNASWSNELGIFLTRDGLVDTTNSCYNLRKTRPGGTNTVIGSFGGGSTANINFECDFQNLFDGTEYQIFVQEQCEIPWLNSEIFSATISTERLPPFSASISYPGGDTLRFPSQIIIIFGQKAVRTSYGISSGTDQQQQQISGQQSSSGTRKKDFDIFIPYTMWIFQKYA